MSWCGSSVSSLTSLRHVSMQLSPVLTADFTAALDAIADGTPKTQGMVIGRAAAAVNPGVESRRRCGHALSGNLKYPRGTKPGEYRFTPGFPFAGAPGWGNVTPFVLKDSAQFRPGPPYDVTSKKYTADFNEIKSLGAKDNSTRTMSRPKSPTFGWRVRRCNGTALRALSPRRRGLVSGRTRGCSPC